MTSMKKKCSRIATPPKMMNHQLPKLKPSTKIVSISISILLISLPLLYAFLLRIPPANLLKDTAFFFLLSNSIVLIVAADSGVFSSSPHAEPNDDIYDEYVARSTALPVAAQRHPDVVHENPVAVRKEKQRSNVSVDSNRAIVVASEKKLGRSQSETAAAERRRRGAAERKAVKRSATVAEKRMSSCGEEESEYWRMSDEELNERVENFIRRFNRGIRMEAIMT